MTGSTLQDLLRQRGTPGGFSADEALPTRKAETWKYTDLRRVEKIVWSLWPAAESHGLTALPDGGPVLEGAIDLVLVNGVLDRDLSQLDGLPSGLSVETGPARDVGSDRFTDRLNGVLAQEHLTIRVDADNSIEAPIHIRHVTWGEDMEAAVCHAARVSIILERNAEASIVESHWSVQGAGFAVPRTAVSLAPDARLGLYAAMLEGGGSTQIGMLDVEIDQAAQLDAFVLSIGAGLTRRESRFVMAGERGDARLSGVYFGTGEALIDNTTLVSHVAENAASRQFFRGVLDDRSRGVFQGKVIVQKGAQGSDGQQQHKALLLSDRAEVDAKPELEIYADDVQCAHGATVGALDTDQLFYLRARGIAEPDARALLTEAFLMEAVERIASTDIRNAFRDVLAVRLKGEAA